MICHKLNYSSVRQYSLLTDWDFADPDSPEPMNCISCDSVSDFALVGLLNWRADGMLQRFQCCVARVGDGFSSHVKQHISNARRKTDWPRYYDFFCSVTVRIGNCRAYYLYGNLKAHLDVIAFSMFTFHPHELRARSGVASWVLNDRRLQGMGIDEVVCSVNNLLRNMGNLAFGYPMHLGYVGSGGSDVRSYAEFLVLAHGG
jgi:hypothetical protein